MKTTLICLALSAACALAGCASDGTFNTASDSSMDTSPMAQNQDRDSAGNASANATDLNAGSVNSSDKTAANNADANAATVTPRDTTQLQMGNDKTDLSAMITENDRIFLQDAAAGQIYEIQASQKALDKSSDAQVKSIAQHMMDDHTKSNTEVRALAQRKGVKLSTLPSGDEIQMLSKLDNLKGSDFDREFLSQQKQAHQDTIAKFESAANSAHDRDVRDWAAGTLPALRDHLAMINNDSNNNVGSER